MALVIQVALVIALWEVLQPRRAVLELLVRYRSATCRRVQKNAPLYVASEAFVAEGLEPRRFFVRRVGTEVPPTMLHPLRPA
ncbi:hypothetical protein [Xanthomonas sp. NCPPB 1128]|uniref:hypothetical protein n=1 Tax=Xanthomonas sp. NCPPB 1128 TaxID=1775876 RepID=UPI0010394782|nr:hypothetical protein [Xanthomonas sp. NCPPB 1128]